MKESRHNMRLAQILEIEREHAKHRQRLAHIKATMLTAKDSNPESSRPFQHKMKRGNKSHKKLDDNAKRIKQQNIHIHEHLRNIYMRSPSVYEEKRQRLNKSRSDRSMFRRLKVEAQREIDTQNLRIQQKLITVQSELSKDRLNESYVQHLSIRNRLHNSTEKYPSMRSLIKGKFNVNTTVLFPKLRSSKKAYLSTDAAQEINRSQSHRQLNFVF